MRDVLDAALAPAARALSRVAETAAPALSAARVVLSPATHALGTAASVIRSPFQDPHWAAFWAFAAALTC